MNQPERGVGNICDSGAKSSSSSSPVSATNTATTTTVSIQATPQSSNDAIKKRIAENRQRAEQLWKRSKLAEATLISSASQFPTAIAEPLLVTAVADPFLEENRYPVEAIPIDNRRSYPYQNVITPFVYCHIPTSSSSSDGAVSSSAVPTSTIIAVGSSSVIGVGNSSTELGTSSNIVDLTLDSPSPIVQTGLLLCSVDTPNSPLRTASVLTAASSPSILSNLASASSSAITSAAMTLPSSQSSRASTSSVGSVGSVSLMATAAEIYGSPAGRVSVPSIHVSPCNLNLNDESMTLNIRPRSSQSPASSQNRLVRFVNAPEQLASSVIDHASSISAELSVPVPHTEPISSAVMPPQKPNEQSQISINSSSSSSSTPLSSSSSSSFSSSSSSSSSSTLQAQPAAIETEQECPICLGTLAFAHNLKCGCSACYCCLHEFFGGVTTKPKPCPCCRATCTLAECNHIRLMDNIIQQMLVGESRTQWEQRLSEGKALKLRQSAPPAPANRAAGPTAAAAAVVLVDSQDSDESGDYEDSYDSEDPFDYCVRCGRDSHTVSSCYARYHIDGHRL